MDIEEDYRERDLEKLLVKIVEDRAGTCEKFTSPSNRHVPDRIITLMDGHIFFVEVKATGKLPTKAQYADHRRRIKMNCVVFVVNCTDDLGTVRVYIERRNGEYLANQQHLTYPPNVR